MTPTHTIFFDGVCGLCNRFIQLVVHEDHADRFRFAALQGRHARSVLAEHGICLEPGAALETVYVLTSDGRLLERAEAGLFVLAELERLRGWATMGRLLPTSLRQLGYQAVARSRYRVFGKAAACLVPGAAIRHKFIED